MTLLVVKDGRARPDLFRWNGQMAPDALAEWLQNRGWQSRCPSDLLEFWQQTGGGDLFESETILGPLGDPNLGDDIDAVNQALRSRGMPERFIVFYCSTKIGAVDIARDGSYAELDGTDYRVLRRFASLDEWYASTLRAEFRGRYGLP